TAFALRTLRDGHERGYEIEISGVRFGLRKGRRHWFVFQRVGKAWSVRMRSNLWSAEGGEITSADVLFSALATPPPSRNRNVTTDSSACTEAPRWFVFNRSGADISEALGMVLEGHVRASGMFRIELDADAVWRFTPHGSGRLVVAPFGFALSRLGL